MAEPTGANAPSFLTPNQAVQELLKRETDQTDDTSELEQDDAQNLGDTADEEQQADAPEEDADADQYADDLDDDDADEDDQDTTEDRYTVTIDGEQREVTLDELQKGYQRQADYTRKTQALSQEQEHLTQAEAEARSNRDQYAQALEQTVQQNKTLLESEPDWQALFDADPIEYVRQKEQWRDRKEAQAKAEAELAGLRAQQQQEQQQLFQQRVAEQQQVLVNDLLPDWQDPEKAKAGQEQIRQYMTQAGFTQEEQQIYDARIVKVLHDAAQFAALQATPPSARKRNKAPKMSPSRKAGRPSRSRAVKGLERQLAATGDPRVAAQLLLERGTK